MKELTKVFRGIDIPVEVIDDENMWFDISSISSRYNKRVSRWRQTDAFKEYIKVVQKCTNLTEPELIRQVGNQTKIHRKIFVNYARYINAEFAYRADEIITDILLGEKSLCYSRYKELEIAKSKKDEQLKISQRNLKEAQSNNRKFYKDGFMSLNKYLKDNEIPLNRDEAFDILYKLDAIEYRDVTSIRRVLVDETFGRQSADGVIEFNSRALDSVFSKYIIVAVNLFDEV